MPPDALCNDGFDSGLFLFCSILVVFGAPRFFCYVGLDKLGLGVVLTWRVKVVATCCVVLCFFWWRSACVRVVLVVAGPVPEWMRRLG